MMILNYPFYDIHQHIYIVYALFAVLPIRIFFPLFSWCITNLHIWHIRKWIEGSRTYLLRVMRVTVHCMHLAIGFTKPTISFKSLKRQRYISLVQRCCQRGGEASYLWKRERLSNPGGLITRRAVSIFAESKWPYVQINPPLLLLKYTMYLGYFIMDSKIFLMLSF